MSSATSSSALATSLPSFEHTSIQDIKSIHSTLSSSFHAHKTRSLDWRLTQLRKLWWGIKDAEQQLFEACKRDIGKSMYESYITEVGWVLNDIIFVCNNLKKWAKEEKAADIPLMMAAMRPRVRKEPLGVVLVLG